MKKEKLLNFILIKFNFPRKKNKNSLINLKIHLLIYYNIT